MTHYEFSSWKSIGQTAFSSAQVEVVKMICFSHLVILLEVVDPLFFKVGCMAQNLLKSAKCFAVLGNLSGAQKKGVLYHRVVLYYPPAKRDSSIIAIRIQRPTPPKTNMEPENGVPLEKEIPIGNHHFQVPC